MKNDLIARMIEFIRQKELRSRLKINPVVCARIQFAGNGQKLGTAHSSMICPMDDGAGAGDVEVCNPACPLHGVKSSPQIEVMLDFIAHKQVKPYINRYGVSIA